MTAISMFPHGRSALIITDGATFDVRDGRICALAPKVAMLPTLRMAIAFQGGGDPQTFVPEHVNLGSVTTQDEVLCKLPAALALYRQNQPVVPRLHSRFCVALYDKRACAPRFFTVSSGRMPDGDTSDIFRLEEVGSLYTGFATVEEPERLVSGDPIEGSRRLLEAQRHHVFDAIGGKCGVAGECGIYTIDRRGVWHQPLIRYPEQVGEHADAQRAGQLL